MARSDMSDLEWEFIKAVLPNRSRGVKRVDVRSYDKDDMIFNPVHYLRLIDHKNETLSAIGPRTMVE